MWLQFLYASKCAGKDVTKVVGKQRLATAWAQAQACLYRTVLKP